MKKLTHLLAFFVIALTLLVSSVKPASALGGWIDHKFVLERPDGTQMDLKGAKIHMYLKQEETTSAKFDHVTNFCAYPEFENNIGGFVDKDNDPGDITLSGGYHCLTPQSCSRQDYGTPYLPKSFNQNIPYSSWDDSSYATFHNGQTFTQSLTGNVSYLANMYNPKLIRGFEGARWDMQLDWTNGTGVAKATQAEIDDIPNQQGGSSWPTVPGFDGTQSWKEGEVYKDPDGGNVLHARITWVLKPPAKPVETIQKPTATLTGKCANSTPGVPSYTYTINNIDLKGQQFADSHLALQVPKGAWTDEFKTQFGPTIYEDNNVMVYSLIYNTTPPSNGSIVQTVLPTEGVGNKPENKKTVKDLVAWVDAKKKAGAAVPAFEVYTTLQSKSADNTMTLNDHIASSGTFKPKFVTNECGTPPPSTTIPACVSLKLLDGGSNPIKNIPALNPGENIRIECGKVGSITKYAFKIVTFNDKGVKTGEQSLKPLTESSNISESYTIPTSGGQFLAQCAVCEGNSTNCAFDIPNYHPPTQTVTRCESPNNCANAGTSCAAGTKVAGAMCSNGNICCTDRTRDDANQKPATPEVAPFQTSACGGNNYCIDKDLTCLTPVSSGNASCGTESKCCTTRTREPEPSSSTAPAPTPYKGSDCNGANSCVPTGSCPAGSFVTGKLCGGSGSQTFTCCKDRTRDQ